MANRIQGTTNLIGLLGYPLKHSRSPHMHNSAFEKLGLDYVYMCFEIPEGKLEDGINALKTFNAPGSNITFPHKQEVLKYLDDISEDAKMIGAVNTIKIDPETKKITGYNTDGRGFIASLDESGVKFIDEKVLLIGLGGAGRAIAINLAYEGVKELVVADLNECNVREIEKIIHENMPNVKYTVIDSKNEEEIKEALKDSKLLVNATALGMKGREELCIITSPDTLHKDLFVYDIVYEPRRTKLLNMAEEAGCKNCNGINMMLWQGAIAFKIWMGVDMPMDFVRGELFEEA